MVLSEIFAVPWGSRDPEQAPPQAMRGRRRTTLRSGHFICRRQSEELSIFPVNPFDSSEAR